jgi:hypothetical protein
VPAPKTRRAGAQVLRIGAVIVVAVVIAVVRGVFSDHSSNGPGAARAPLDVWESTPASTYAIDDAGIQLPAATAVDGFTADEVAADLLTVKKILTAGRLDDTLRSNSTRTAPGCSPPIAAGPAVRRHQFTYYGTQLAPGQTLADECATRAPSRSPAATTTAQAYITTSPSGCTFGGTLKEPGDHL